ncbi:helix-turn-helix transcriptional regulator [Halarchaeum sp. P4]|uniref:helix-turn-helix transcriptional regulator n=1 Tax=Halarchaeum sp. P4 TaxID=3421639 RepID=UPI003EBBBD96
MDAYEAANFVFGSRNRLSVLRSLRTEPGRPRGVADRVGVSRATAQRCLRTCADEGWVERVDGDYQLTPVGERVVERALGLLEEFGVLDEQEALFADLPPFDPPLPPAGLADTDIVTATREQPHRAAQAFADHVRECGADQYDCVSPTMTQLYIDAFGARIEDGASVELVCPDSVLDAERDVRPDNVARSLALPTFDLYVRPEELDYALVLTDEEVCLGAIDETQALSAVVWTDDADVHAWARERYDREKAAAEKVTQTG